MSRIVPARFDMDVPGTSASPMVTSDVPVSRGVRAHTSLQGVCASVTASGAEEPAWDNRGVGHYPSFRATGSSRSHRGRAAAQNSRGLEDGQQLNTSTLGQIRLVNGKP